jgi:hypothetical protein
LAVTATEPLPVDPVCAAFARLADAMHAVPPPETAHAASRSIPVIRSICLGLLALGLLGFAAMMVIASCGFYGPS